MPEPMVDWGGIADLRGGTPFVVENKRKAAVLALADAAAFCFGRRPLLGADSGATGSGGTAGYQ